MCDLRQLGEKRMFSHPFCHQLLPLFSGGSYVLRTSQQWATIFPAGAGPDSLNYFRAFMTIPTRGRSFVEKPHTRLSRALGRLTLQAVSGEMLHHPLPAPLLVSKRVCGVLLGSVRDRE